MNLAGMARVVHAGFWPRYGRSMTTVGAPFPRGLIYNHCGKKRVAKDHFLMRVLDKPKLFVLGSRNELGQAAG